jgi:hypothetical protein
VWFVGASSLAVLAAAAVSGLIFYEKTIVPSLPTVTSVPLWWWGLSASPVWIAALILGWHATSILELAGASAAGAIGSQVYLYWASITQRPGLVNQPLAETDPAVFWTAGTLVCAAMLAAPYSAGYLGRRAVNGRRAS